MKKVWGALLVIAAVSFYLTLREQGDEAFGGIFKPVDSVRADSDSLSPAADPLGVMTTGSSVPGVSQTNYKQMVDRVRTRVNDAMDESVERSSRY